MDAADLEEWRAAYGLTDGGDTDGTDFLIWQRNLAAESDAVYAVPEPVTLTSLVMLAVAVRGAVARGPRRLAGG